MLWELVGTVSVALLVLYSQEVVGTVSTVL